MKKSISKKTVKKTVKKKPVKKKPLKKTKKQNIKKISFLTKRKNINDMFFDIVEKETKLVPKRFKNGRIKEGVFIREGATKLAKKLKISTKTLDTYIKKGKINEDLYYLTRSIEDNFKKLKIGRIKKVTKEFTIHNFTFDNFFAKKRFVVKRDEQLYFRAGLYIAFQRIKKTSTGSEVNLAERLNMYYTIQNFPISHKSNSYPQGYREFFDIIKIQLQEFPSLLFFRFNYFDVTKVNLADF